jgi:anti-sigma-K factor RskA
LNPTHCTADDSAAIVLGNPDAKDQDLVRAHLRDHCEVCVEEMKEALEFWYVFAALTERTQDMSFPEPTPMLRDRVIAITRQSRHPVIQNWLRIGAVVLIAAGAAGLSWNLGRYEIERNMSAVQTRADQQAASAKKLESKNDALRELKKAAVLLAAASRGNEELDRQHRKALSAAIAEKAALHAKVQDLEGRIARYRAALLQAHAVSVVQFHGTGAASGAALIADDSRLTFFPANLPAAPAGRTYQLWLILPQGTVNAGTFSSSEVLSNKLPLSGLEGLAVTEEPAGGSPQPTGPKILTGTPR